MRWIVFLIVCVLSLLIFQAVTEEHFTSTEPPAVEVPVEPKPDQVQIAMPTLRWGYSVIVVEQPIGQDMENKEIIRGYERYVTDVEGITDEPTDEFKSQRLDKEERNLWDEELTPVYTFNKNFADAVNIPSFNADIKIVSRDIYIFESYTDASNSRHKLMENTNYNPNNSDL